MPIYDPTDPEQVASAERLRARERQRDLADLRAVLALPEGRRWLWRVMAETQAFRSSFDPDSAARMAFREGRRAVGLWLLDALAEAAPDAFPSLMAETWAAAQLPTTPTDEDDD
jgi:hypothetical protein